MILSWYQSFELLDEIGSQHVHLDCSIFVGVLDTAGIVTGMVVVGKLLVVYMQVVIDGTLVLVLLVHSQHYFGNIDLERCCNLLEVCILELQLYPSALHHYCIWDLSNKYLDLHDIVHHLPHRVQVEWSLHLRQITLVGELECLCLVI